MTLVAYKRNRMGTVQAAHSGAVRIGYIDCSDEHRWIWSLNTIQPGGGRATGIAESELLAKDALEYQWMLWLNAAGLTFKEQHGESVHGDQGPADRGHDATAGADQCD